MKITIPGNELLEVLREQKERVLMKRDELKAYAERHKKTHKSGRLDDCDNMTMVNALFVSIDNHLRRLYSLIAAIELGKDYRLNDTHFIKNYVDAPTDTLMIPTDDDEEISTLSRLGLN